ncbi:hypothetical protein L9F63_008366, partial [Diploptera punctata]
FISDFPCLFNRFSRWPLIPTFLHDPTSSCLSSTLMFVSKYKYYYIELWEVSYRDIVQHTP